MTGEKLIYLIFGIQVLCACQNESAKEIVARRDSASVTSSNAPTDLKKFMDSLSKANGGKSLSITVNGAEDQADPQKSNVNPSDLKTLNERKLDELLSSSKKKYILLHCWATWCGPCRKELPAFITKVKSMQQTEVLLISFDYDSEAQRKKVLNYVMTLNTTLPVYIISTLDKTNPTNKESGIRFIQTYDKKYAGDIPYNVLINTKTKQLIRASANYNDVMASANE